MLDRLLGRAKLKDRIDELAEEKRRLEEQLDAESERRREAVRERQEAEERVNRLEDRITELEDRVERAEAGEEGPDFRGTETLRGERLHSVLARLESVDAGEEGALTAMVEDGSIPDQVQDAFGDRTPLVERAAPCLVYTDDAGLVSAALSPPIAPDPFVAWDDVFHVDRGWFEPTGDHAIALVRADVFALGEYETSRATERTSGRGPRVERVDFEGFESDVKGKHSKGGFSQGRFERRRESQIEEHLQKCREAIESREADTLYVVGEKTLLSEFRDVADATKPVDATGKPEEAFGQAVDDFWSVPLRLV